MRFLLLPPLFFVFACGHPSATQPAAPPTGSAPAKTPAPLTDDDRLVVPGERLGKLALGETDKEAFDRLGRPDSSDAAMGSANHTWLGKGGTRLDVFVSYKDSTMREKAVKQIRSTSGYFETEGGLKVGENLGRLRKAVPALADAKALPAANGHAVYDDTAEGIAFEMQGSGNSAVCAAVIVHEKGRPVRVLY